VVKPRKQLIRLAGGSLADVRFGDFKGLVEAFGFSLKRVERSI
jgi:hypothetical protein